jgi:hypothetical protein
MNNEETVKLISSDGFEFIMEKKEAVFSKTISNMLMNTSGKSCFMLFLLSKTKKVTFPIEFQFWHASRRALLLIQ